MSAQSSDGSYEDLFAAEITAESEDDSVATVVIETSADTLTRSVIIDAVSEGSTTIEIQVSMNGKLIGSKHIPVVVDAQDAPGKGMLCISITDCEDVEIQDADIIGEGLTPDFEMGRDNEFNVGTEFILTAGDVEGKRFVCWQDANSKRILAINKTISFKLGSGTYLKAVYTSTENGTLVQFVDRNYKVLQRNYLNETSTSVTAPSPYSVGYDFNVWKSEQMDVQGGDTVTSEQIGGLIWFLLPIIQSQVKNIRLRYQEVPLTVHTYIYMMKRCPLLPLRRRKDINLRIDKRR